MNDVLEGGRRRPPPPPGWGWAVVGLAVVVAVVIVMVVRRGPHGVAVPAPSRSASPTSVSSPSVADATRPGPVATGPAAWPYAPSACNGTAYLPQVDPVSHYDTVIANLIVGGARLLKVAADRPQAMPMLGVPDEPGWLVDALVAGPDADYARAGPCEGSDAGRVYRIVGDVAQPIDVTADFLIGGAHHAWQVSYASPSATPSGAVVRPGAVLTPLDGGQAIALEPNAYPVADTAAGLVVARSDPVDVETPPILELVDTSTGMVSRTLADGYPLAADDHLLLVQAAGCSAAQPPIACTLKGVDLSTGTTTRDYPLPPGRTPVSNAVISADGRLTAFQLMRAGQDPRFDTGHPGSPSDVAILHLDTGQLDVVPGLELAPKTVAGLAFDNTGTSLFMTVSQGDGGQLLIWQGGMSGPALVTTLPGPVDGAPPLLVLEH